MALSNSKRKLIFARSSVAPDIRPPWSIREGDFVELCTRCGECFKECPSHVIRIADGGFPVLDFSHSGCDFCAVCVDVCKPGALTKNDLPALNIIAEIDERCFALRDVICRCCEDVCQLGAIQFKPVAGGIRHVELRSDICNGCGECVHICPAQSIGMKRRNIDK